jgi:hypothetical protein
MGDPILRVTTTGINFPGQAIRTIATVGYEKVFGADPELQITHCFVMSWRCNKGRTRWSGSW